ncbi:MAG: hypothetical protein M3R04_00060 [bacterium]|nr:hypothetical protein [bacterium]
MKTGMQSSGGNGMEPRRSAKLGQLLASARTPEVLPWSRVEAIVASAPAARRSIFSLSFASPPMRLASGLAAVLVALTGALAVIPAEAEHVGTIISAELPKAWVPGSVQVAEFKAAAQQRFAALDLPDSQLYVLNVAHDNGQPELAMVLQNVDSAVAGDYYADLAADYPALDADDLAHRVQPVEGDSPGSLLSVALVGAVQPSRLSGMSDSDARIAVLQALSDMGLKPTEVTTERRADGTLVIQISADMQIQVAEGHKQEALAELLDAAE